ncbi:MAG: hypothetical protein M3Z75_16480 [Actinomycetota bacterium]|nr:hypothetical protein [Actinomycetota bacterium]
MADVTMDWGRTEAELSAADEQLVRELTERARTCEPDGETAIRVVNGLRDRRVLISTTGPHGNSLKIRRRALRPLPRRPARRSPGRQPFAPTNAGTGTQTMPT